MTKVRPLAARRPPTPDPKDVVCPHQHFKYNQIDRDILSRKQHLNLLCTPKGYRWVVVKDYPLDMTPDEVSSNPCRVSKKKPGKTYVHNILAELWELLTPEMVTRLKEMLMVEFGLSEEAAVEFICHSRHDTLRIAHRTKQRRMYEEDDEDFKTGEGEEDPTLPRLIVEPKMCDKSQFAVGIDPCHIREFSRIVSTKFSEYVVAMMCARRNNRHRRMAEVVLNGLCELTGENTSLDNPKNRLHKILAMTSDRVALWLAQNMDEEDIKRDRRRKREDEALRRKQKEKQKEQDRRRKEKDRMNKEIERNRKRREKEEEEEEKRKQEEQEKNNAEKEKRRQEIEKFREQDKKKKGEDKNKDKKDGNKKEVGQKKKGEGKDGKPKARPKSAQAGGDRGGSRTDKSSTDKDQKSSKVRSQQKTDTQRPSSNKPRAGNAASQSSKSSTSKAGKQGGAPTRRSQPGGAPTRRSQPVDAINEQGASGEERAQGSSDKTFQPDGRSLADGGPVAPSDGTEQDQSVADGTPSQPVPGEGGGGVDAGGPQPKAETAGAPGEGKESREPAGPEPVPSAASGKGTESQEPVEPEPVLSAASRKGTESQEPAEPKPVPSAASGKGTESREPDQPEPVPSAASSEGIKPEGLQTGDKMDQTAEQSVPASAQAVGGGPQSQPAKFPEKGVEERIIAATTTQIGGTKIEATPRQETLQDIMNKTLEKRIQPKDKSTAEAIREVASKTATWIDQNVKDAEVEYGARDKLSRMSPVSQKPKGPLYVLRKIDPSEEIYDVSTSTYTDAGNKIRNLRRRASGRNVTASPTDPSDPKMWAKWAENASEMADDWGRWIDKTIQDAEDKAVQYQAKAKDGIAQPEDNEDWNRFVETTNEDALTWRRMKKSFDEAAKEWKLQYLYQEP